MCELDFENDHEPCTKHDRNDDCLQPKRILKLFSGIEDTTTLGNQELKRNVQTY